MINKEKLDAIGIVWDDVEDLLRLKSVEMLSGENNLGKAGAIAIAANLLILECRKEVFSAQSFEPKKRAAARLNS